MYLLKVPVGSQDHAQGPADAPVTLVEYGDYECSYCGEAYSVVRELQGQFGDDLRFVYRNFPLEQLHSHAVSAAATAEFAGDHGQFWQAHDALFEHQRELGLPLYERIVVRYGLSSDAFRAALESGEYLARITGDSRGGVRSGVNGTPSFFINEQRYDGAADPDSLSRALVAAARRGSTA